MKIFLIFSLSVLGIFIFIKILTRRWGIENPKDENNELDELHRKLSLSESKVVESVTAKTKQPSNGRKSHLHRHGNHPNNMNCDRYFFSGKYTATRKMRTKREAFVFENEDPLQVIKDMGYEDPIEYTFQEWPEMSDAQKAVLYDRTNGHYQRNLCSYDASGLLDQILDGKSRPSDSLFDYTKAVRIPASYYYSDDRLQGTILHDLQAGKKGKECLAFKVYTVYCELWGLPVGNLIASEHKDVFYGFSANMTEDEANNYAREMWISMDDERKLKDRIKEYLRNCGLVKNEGKK